MAFVFEEIPADEIGLYDWSHCKVYPGDIPIPDTAWFIDRDRGAFLIYIVFGVPNNALPDFFCLYWRGEVFFVEANKKYEECAPNPASPIRYITYWTVESIGKSYGKPMPVKFKPLSAELLELVRDALLQCNYNDSPNREKEMSVVEIGEDVLWFENE